MAILTLENNNMVKNIIIVQAKQIADLKYQLDEYKSIVNNNISNNSAVKNESLPPTPSSIPSDRQEPIPTNKSKGLTLVLPTKHTFKKRVKASIELDGYGHDAHFQHLLFEDSKLPNASRNHRWNFSFRFCAYFVHAGQKIFIKTLVHGQKKQDKKLTVKSFPGLCDYLIEKNVDAHLLEMPLTSETVEFFTDQENQKEIVKFLYAFCALLYSFLPQYKRVYKVKGNLGSFHLSAASSNQQDNDITLVEIKEEEKEAKVRITN